MSELNDYHELDETNTQSGHIPGYGVGIVLLVLGISNVAVATMFPVKCAGMQTGVVNSMCLAPVPGYLAIGMGVLALADAKLRGDQ